MVRMGNSTQLVIAVEPLTRTRMDKQQLKSLLKLQMRQPSSNTGSNE